MRSTVLLLLFTIIIIPLFSFYFGTPLNDLQWKLLSNILPWVVGVVLYTFVIGEWTGNNSQVDKLWSIVPIFYVWKMTMDAQWNDRMVIMSCLVTLWGVRLTYNFARRGAYRWKFWEGEEDYRWEILRQRPEFSNRWVWMFFNLLFICFYQNVLIFLFCLPTLAVLTEPLQPVGMGDVTLAILMVVLVVVEFIADQQQYVFQTEKYRRIRQQLPLLDYAHGFVRTGLWKWVRHPNYACEQGIWIVYYMFSVVSTGQWINWSMSGCVLLMILFKGSSDFSEKISAEKYPEYSTYQVNTPRFIPFFNGNSR